MTAGETVVQVGLRSLASRLCLYYDVLLHILDGMNFPHTQRHQLNP